VIGHGGPIDPRAPFGTRLRALRERAGLTQEELAERAGLSAQAIGALERGARSRPYPSTVRALVGALRAFTGDQASLLVGGRGTGGADSRDAPGPSSGAIAGALPVPVTALVGREDDVSEITAALLKPEVRLLTLTGTGGVGKTRLAVAVAGETAHRFADGVVFVPLAAVDNAALVVPAVARGTGLAAPEGPDPETALAAHLRERRTLLVLDNFEHLTDAAVAVSRLLAACPLLTVLVTSRAALRLLGENEYPVRPLTLPSGPDPDVEEVAWSPAVRLFMERAQAVAGGFRLSPQNAATVAAICARLSGIPLALELAAARVRSLDPQTLLARLDEAMTLGGPRDLPWRQRTMRATLDWSHDLLREDEQQLFRRLEVFTGGFTLEAAEAVAGPGGALRPLEGLVEQSLVTAVCLPGRPVRYHMLEPVAQYARARLTTSEALEAGRAHAAYFLTLAERAAPEYQRADQVRWLALTETEDGNLSTAITWALDNEQPETAARLCWSLWLYWWIRGRLILGRRLLEATLEHPLPASLRSRARASAGAIAFAQGDLAAAERHWRQACEDAQAAGDDVALAHARPGVGLVALADGNPETAADLFRSAIRLARHAGPGAEWIESLTHVWLGTAVMVTAGPAAAEAPIRRGLASARARGDRLTTFVALFNLSQAAIEQGDHEMARGYLEEGIRLSEQVRDLANLAYFLDALAVVEDTTTGDPVRVSTLLGAARSLRETAGADVYGYYLPDESLRERAASRARASLDGREYADAVAAGRAMTLEEITKYATAPDGC
jgi:predicted ATPase/transcriptional regulator with XRE-family HTH domain